MKQRKEVEAKLEMERRAAEDRQRELQSLKEQIRMKRASIQRLDEAFSGGYTKIHMRLNCNGIR